MRCEHPCEGKFGLGEVLQSFTWRDLRRPRAGLYSWPVAPPLSFPRIGDPDRKASPPWTASVCRVAMSVLMVESTGATMPFDIEPYGGNAAVGRVRIFLRDRVDRSEAMAISQSCRRFGGRCRIFYLDLADMGEISREILAWLGSYLRWGRETGVSVRIVNAAAHHLSSLRVAGISECGTAALGERLCTVSGADDAWLPAADAETCNAAAQRVLGCATEEHGPVLRADTEEVTDTSSLRCRGITSRRSRARRRGGRPC